ncbi:MAG: flagellar basal body-associated FliL family protein [Desulfamplus sp.]|nr:flagellar basal body-associated FliL family protein [Desulfamplus sp.]
MKLLYHFSLRRMVAVSLLFFIAISSLSGCKGDSEEMLQLSPTHELLVGSWNRYSNKIYTLLILRNNGSWSSDLRIEGGASKIVERRGSATGTWRLEDDDTLIINVMDSEMEEVWAKGSTYVLDIVEIDKRQIILRYPNARLITWKRSRVKRQAKVEGILYPVLNMKPLIVNINKLSSHDKDRYLCLALDLHLEEITDDQDIPKLHPRAWDAAIIYLSSLVYKDVKTFDEMKVVTAKLFDLLNPYLEGHLTEIEVKHVMISSSMDKVDEFIIEHSPPPPQPTEA